jgi:hypothetical protein
MSTDKAYPSQGQHIIDSPRRLVGFVARDQTGRLHHYFRVRSQYSETRFTSDMEDLLGVPFHACHVPESSALYSQGNQACDTDMIPDREIQMENLCSSAYCML